jgi:hypothetical protein
MPKGSGIVASSSISDEEIEFDVVRENMHRDGVPSTLIPVTQSVLMSEGTLGAHCV